jgi:hypothetical protein
MTDRLITHLTPEELDAWLEGALTPQRETHLHGCADCRQLADSERELVHLLGALPLLSPRPGFGDRVIARLPLRRRVRPAAIAAGLLVPMAASVAWSLANQDLLSQLIQGTGASSAGSWVTIRSLGSTLLEQPWYPRSARCSGPPPVSGSCSAPRPPPMLAAWSFSGACWPRRRNGWPMRKADRHLLLAAFLTCLPVLASATPGDPRAPGNTAERLRGLLDPDPAPTARHHLASVTPSSAELIFRLRDHSEFSVELSEGVVRIGREPVGHYSPGGDLEDAWWELVSSAASLPTADAVLMVREWAPRGLQGDEAKAASRIRERTRQVAAPPSPRPAAPEAAGRSTPDLGDQARSSRSSRAVREAGQGSASRCREARPAWAVSPSAPAGVVGHLMVLQGTADVRPPRRQSAHRGR